MTGRMPSELMRNQLKLSRIAIIISRGCLVYLNYAISLCRNQSFSKAKIQYNKFKKLYSLDNKVDVDEQEVNEKMQILEEVLKS